MLHKKISSWIPIFIISDHYPLFPSRRWKNIKKSFALSEIIYMSSRKRESKIIQNKPFHFVMNVNEEGKWKHTTARKKMWTKEREDNSTFYVDFESILWKFRVSQRKCTELELFFIFLGFFVATQILSFFFIFNAIHQRKHTKPKIT